MKAKCKKCGDTVEVTRPKEFKSCKCGAISLDYGDEFYYRVCGSLEDFDGEIEDIPKIKDLGNPNRYKVKSRQMGKAMDIIGEENIGGESKPMGKVAKTSEVYNLSSISHSPEFTKVDNFWAEMAEQFKKLGKLSDLIVQKECFETLAKLCEEKSESR